MERQGDEATQIRQEWLVARQVIKDLMRLLEIEDMRRTHPIPPFTPAVTLLEIMDERDRTSFEESDWDFLNDVYNK